MPKIKMAAMNGKYIHNTCIFGRVRNSNDIPTAIPMFSRSGNTTEVREEQLIEKVLHARLRFFYPFWIM